MPGRSALIFVYVWPEPRSSAAGVRTRELIAWLQSAGWSVTAVSPSKPSVHSDELNALGVNTITADPNDAGQDEELRRRQPDLVLFDRFVTEEQYGWKSRELWPRALGIVDTQDLHSVRRAREAWLKAGAGLDEIAERRDLPLGDDLLRELSSLYRAGNALVVSGWEADFLRRCGFPEAALLHLPFTAALDPAPNPRPARRGLAFLGNFRHLPNLDGIRWFIREIWPKVREQDPAQELHLYGAYPTAEISGLDGKDGIHAHGPVEDHRAALRRHSALVAPLRFGAGIKGKVLEAWGTGTPVLGTRMAFEGIGEQPELVFSDAESFLLAMGNLEKTWDSISAQGQETLRNDFDPKQLRDRFLAFLDLRTAATDQDTLIGAMLRYHQHNSLKYFSRWIEAKNKK